MLFNPELDEDNEESEPIIKANALTLFHVQQDGSYVANIINPKLYELVLKDTSSSLLCDLPTQPALGFAAAWQRCLTTSFVESDFSILKCEKDAYRVSLIALSLEGVFQTKQLATIREILGLIAPRDAD
ncbi:hypothetical protein DYB30_012982 [Aphanomyces astaci]|uniref:Uncharacterized protein n=1 Tax=Aphanomyces astaci TaxID=112090 RepID=A0A397E2Y4_APHAT|nr:hypothetical protein DYB30_012982 [Aphanomyces astaci]RHY74882.1 hypothetical protein DYB34_010756 [Aphanomyces astaci]RHZ30719.1 hypothetical protein DYB31_011032 [Aphanomyces astaci]